MENTPAVQDSNTLTAKEIKAQVNLIQSVMEAVMKKDTHYGIIPGCKKPSLWKPGSEKILMTFRLVADNPIIEDLSITDVIRYRVTQRILDSKGRLVGAASGECSSDEEKYKWRRPVCDSEFEETPEDRKRLKWSKGFQGAKDYQQKQIRTNPADVGNTILKMAIKRALVAATLTVTAASDVFDQDLEDLPAEVLDTEGGPVTAGKPAVEMPQEKQPNDRAKKLTDLVTLVGKLNERQKSDFTNKLGTEYSVSSINELTDKQLDEIAAKLRKDLNGK